jgi:hypothetical protein
VKLNLLLLHEKGKGEEGKGFYRKVQRLMRSDLEVLGGGN